MSTIPKGVRSDVLERDDFTCQRCKISILGRAYSLHHRKGRRGEDSHSRANLVVLCGSGSTGCHGHVHGHPNEAYSSGFMIHRLGFDDPADVPLVDIAGHGFLLTHDGRTVPTDSHAAGVCSDAPQEGIA